MNQKPDVVKILMFVVILGLGGFIAYSFGKANGGGGNPIPVVVPVGLAAEINAAMTGPNKSYDAKYLGYMTKEISKKMVAETANPRVTDMRTVSNIVNAMGHFGRVGEGQGNYPNLPGILAKTMASVGKDDIKLTSDKRQDVINKFNELATAFEAVGSM